MDLKSLSTCKSKQSHSTETYKPATHIKLTQPGRGREEPALQGELSSRKTKVYSKEIVLQMIFVFSLHGEPTNKNKPQRIFSNNLV